MDVAGVHIRSWQHAYRGAFPDEYLDRLRREDRAARYTLEGRRDQPLTIVADERGSIRGFATIGASPPSTCDSSGELLALYVDPADWGRGIGRVLIHEARAQLADRGFESALLWVLTGNERAERFYRADGWRFDGGRRTEEVWGVLADEVRYRRLLK